MAKLVKLIELNSLEKQNRKNRLEDKFRQKEYYGDIEQSFDPFNKTLTTKNETMQTYNETWQAHIETMQALQTKTLEALTLNNEQQRSFLEMQAAPLTLKDDIRKTFAVDNDMIDILLLMGKQTNKQIELKSVDPNSNNFKLNGVVPDGIKMKGKVYDFLKG